MKMNHKVESGHIVGKKSEVPATPSVAFGRDGGSQPKMPSDQIAHTAVKIGTTRQG